MSAPGDIEDKAEVKIPEIVSEVIIGEGVNAEEGCWGEISLAVLGSTADIALMVAVMVSASLGWEPGILSQTLYPLCVCRSASRQFETTH